MKKILLSMFVCSAIVSSMTAQQKQSNLLISTNKENNKIESIPSRTNFKNTPAKKTRGGSFFIRYIDFVAAQEGISETDIDANNSLFNMFPDSTMRYNPPSQAYGIQYKSIGQVLDPSAPTIAAVTPPGEWFISKNDSYTVDSIFVLGSYAKVTASVDTMIMSVVHSGGANMPEFYFSGQMADFNEDTTRFLAQQYSETNFVTGPFQNNVTGAPASYITKRALSNTDSSDYVMGASSYKLKYMGFSANNFAVPAGEKASVSFTFKPGFTYAAGDSIGKNNKYLFMSCEPKGNSSFIPYYPQDRNMSSVISKDSSGWGGFYIPTLAFTAPYSPEMHDIIWKVSCTSCFPNAVEEVNSSILSTVSPNPATSNVTFALNLKESAKNVTIEISNPLGQVVKTTKLGSIAANVDTKNIISVSDLSAGMYIYTINADGQKSSNKLMVK